VRQGQQGQIVSSKGESVADGTPAAPDKGGGPAPGLLRPALRRPDPWPVAAWGSSRASNCLCCLQAWARGSGSS